MQRISCGRLRSRFLQQLADFEIAHLPEVAIMRADGDEGIGRMDGHDLVRDFAQFFARLDRRNWDCDNDMRGFLTANRVDRDAHRRPRRQPVVDQDDDLPREIRARTSLPVGSFAPAQFFEFFLHPHQELAARDAERFDDVVVHGVRAAARNRTHRELAMVGDADLTNDQNIERSLERARNLVGDRDPSPRECQDDDVVAIGIGAQQSCQRPTGFAAILEPVPSHTATSLLTLVVPREGSIKSE
jgi:hypothetical protein